MSITKRIEDGCEITEYTGADLKALKASLTKEIHGETAAGCCVNCKQPFSAANVFSPAGWRETRLSRMCEQCWDVIFSDDDEDEPDEDPTPWCSGCGAMTRAKCKCGPIADNE